MTDERPHEIANAVLEALQDTHANSPDTLAEMAGRTVDLGEHLRGQSLRLEQHNRVLVMLADVLDEILFQLNQAGIRVEVAGSFDLLDRPDDD